MGYTPLEGLIMETRCGDIDPAVILKIMRIENYSVDEMVNRLKGLNGKIYINENADEVTLDDVEVIYYEDV